MKKTRTKRRPQWLVMITRPGEPTELFSAHHSDDEARHMGHRLLAITSNCNISVIEVPDIAGISPVIDKEEVAAEPMLPPVPVAAAPAPKMKPFRKVSQEEFQAESDAMMKDGLIGDTLVPEYMDAVS